MLQGLFLAALVMLAGSERPSPTSPRAIYSYDTKKPQFALTFDDGPNPAVTPRLLEVLRRHKARATFFVIGRQAQKYPDLLQQEQKDGHEVANHSMSHRYMRRTSATQLEEELTRSHDLLGKLLGTASRFYRPPGAIYNRAMLHKAAQLGERTVLWNIETKDWQGRSHTVITNQVLKSLSPGDIVLFHDGVVRTETLQAVDEILTATERLGLHAVTLSELAKGASPRHQWGPGPTKHRAPQVAARVNFRRRFAP